ncbi:MAG: DEAD/DEAH box helicase [Puniceicoccales bacterium]
MAADKNAGQTEGLRLEENGRELVPQLVLPPNLQKAIERSGQAVVKLELRVDGESIAPENLDRGAGYSFSEGAAKVLWMLENWCGRWPGSILQLSTERLQELRTMAAGEPIFKMHGSDEPLQAFSEPLLWIAEQARKSKDGKPASAPTRKAAVPKATPERSGSRRAPERSLITPGTIDGSEHYLAIQLPSPDHSAYEEIRERVKADRFKLEPSNRKWWLRERGRVLEFLAKFGEDIEHRWRLKPTENFRKRMTKIRTLEPKISVKARGKDSGEYTVSVDWKGASEEEVYDAVRKGKSHVESGKRIYLVNPRKVEEVKQLKEKVRAASGALDPFATFSESNGKFRVKGEALPVVEETLAEIDPEWVSPDEWRESVRRLRDPDAVEIPDLPDSVGSRLRGYQKIGVAWFWNLHQNHLGGLLADEMGLGKTVQSLGLIGTLAKTTAKPALVICPASLVENWVRETNEFLPTTKAHGYHGASRNLDFGSLDGRDLIITSYGTLRADRALFLKAEFSTIIADEAQHFKNPSTETARVIRRLQGESRFALTGTPIENSIADLAGIGRFALPTLFSGKRPTAKLDVERTMAQVRPYLLRRTKAEVLSDLPEKWESRRFVALTEAQQKLYREIRTMTEQRLYALRASGAKSGRLTAELWTELLRLRQATAEPRILDPDLPREASAKSEGLREIIEEAIDGGSRMLVFSQFTQTLGWLRKDLEKDGIPYCYLDGSTRNRQDLVDRFNADDSIPVFLLSLKAGGTGLNLTGADIVVHYDPWWNPAAEAQATDRAHRIGQTKKVQSIKLIGTGTVEEKVLQMQDEKRELLGSLFEGEGGSESVMNLEALMELVEG